MKRGKDLLHMGVSKNNGTPKSSILIEFSTISHPFWDTPIFGNTHINLVPSKILLLGSDCALLIQKTSRYSTVSNPNLGLLPGIFTETLKRWFAGLDWHSEHKQVHIHINYDEYIQMFSLMMRKTLFKNRFGDDDDDDDDDVDDENDDDDDDDDDGTIIIISINELRYSPNINCTGTFHQLSVFFLICNLCKWLQFPSYNWCDWKGEMLLSNFGAYQNK